MEKHSIENQGKVLRVLIDLCKQQEERTIFMSDFADKIVDICKFVSSDDLCTIIEILRDEGLIIAPATPYRNELNVHSIAITPKGYNFHPQKEYINKLRWSDRIWGFLTGSLFTAVISFIISRF